MTRIRARAERIIDAEPADVWAALTDYEGARRRMLPENYLDFHAERGESGEGEAYATLTYRLRAGGRERGYRMQVEAPTPGAMLIERDQLSSFTTRWRLERVGPGAHTRVRLSSEWESHASGPAGFFERSFAPLGVARIHRETLVRLGHLMRERSPSTF